jgi:hypothetical protein
MEKCALKGYQLMRRGGGVSLSPGHQEPASPIRVDFSLR